MTAARYTTYEIQSIWQDQGRITRMRKASLASAFITMQAYDLDGEFYEACESAIMQVSPGEWKDFEAQYDHDIAGWVAAVRSHLDPKWHRYWHRDRTSSDLVETAQALGLLETAEVLNVARENLARACAVLALRYQSTLVLGRTHGQEAEPTTIGRKMALFVHGLAHNPVAQYRVTKMSGPVGTNPVPRDAMLGLSSIGLGEVPSTQIVPRWYLASLLGSVVTLSVVVSQLAMEIRLGSQSGVEIYRERSHDQARGSSAMPQKRNPIRSERASGLLKVVRMNAAVVIETGAELWNERDISHSSVERSAMVDAFQLLHYVMRDMTGVLSRLEVTAANESGPTGVSALNALLDDGVSYDEAYERVKLAGPGAAPHSRPRAYTVESEPDLWAMVHRVAAGGKR